MISEIVEPHVFGLKGETPSFKKADADLSLIVLSISEINPLALRNASSATIKGALATASCLASDARNSEISFASLSGSSGIGPNASIWSDIIFDLPVLKLCASNAAERALDSDILSFSKASFDVSPP